MSELSCCSTCAVLCLEYIPPWLMTFMSLSKKVMMVAKATHVSVRMSTSINKTNITSTSISSSRQFRA